MSTQRADVYSLGALVYKLITGSILTDLFLVAHEPELLDPIPEPLHDLIIRATYHDRDRRFPDTVSFGEALADIQALLDDDPPDTPPLVIPVEEKVLDPSARDPFPEIAPLLRPDTPHPAPAATVPESLVSDEPPVLPYTMPQVDPSLSPPAYVLDGMPPERLTPTPPPAPRTPSLPPPEPEPEFDWWAITPATRYLAAAALVAWLGLFSLVGWGAVTVTRAGTEALSARRVFYGVLDKERVVLADLERQGVPARPLRSLWAQYEAFERADEEAIRWAEAEQYLTRVAAAATSRAAQERVGRMQEAHQRARDGRAGWFRRANTSTAAMAKPAPSQWLTVEAQAAPAMPKAGIGPTPGISNASRAAFRTLMPIAMRRGVCMSCRPRRAPNVARLASTAGAPSRRISR